MAVCCQNLTLGALSSRSVLSVLVGALFKKFGLFLNTSLRDTVAPSGRKLFQFAVMVPSSVFRKFWTFLNGILHEVAVDVTW
jgi:hypothetical protein